jgi:NAD(P)-dependent dehydrogenase (short-subunit alcohol dehydrogenase family)
VLLQDNVIIVTGGANGIGREVCNNFCDEGARVVVADLDGSGAEALAAKLNEGADTTRALGLRVDVTSESDAKMMVERTVAAFGRIDVLVNNAGVYPHVDFEDITLDAWRRVMSINLDSVFICSKAVLPQMKAQEHGKIINIATNLVWTGLASMAHYIASKAGVVGFTRALARELGEHGITVNAMAPGAVIPEAMLNDTSKTRVKKIVDAQCLRRPLRTNDLVGPLIFLASRDSDFISGQVFTVDGGLAMH